MAEQQESEQAMAAGEDYRWMNWFPHTQWMADWKAGFEDFERDCQAGKYSGNNLIEVLSDWSADNGGGPWVSGFTVNCSCGRTVRGKIWDLEQLVDPKFRTKKRLATATLGGSVL